MKILFWGDICPTDDYRKLFDDETGDLLFHDVKNIVSEADYVVCNFECPATTNIKAIKKCGPSLKAKPEDLNMLKNVGISGVSLANNHSLDYGTKGLNETIEACNKYGVSYFGVEVKGDLKNDKLVLKKDNEYVTILSFSEEEFNYSKEEKTGAIHFDPYDSFDKIKKAKELGKVVVLYHGGIEYYRYPTPLLRKKCLKMVQSGADVVLCQHSHIIGTKESVGDSYILYGQGNFVFGYRENSNTWNEGLSVLFDTEKGVLLDVIVAKEDGIYIAEKNYKNKILSNVEEVSSGWTDEFIEEKFKEFCENKKALYYPLLYGKGRIYNKVNRLTKNKLFNACVGKKKKMVSMNLIRCDAHNEVIKTLLEKDYK